MSDSSESNLLFSLTVAQERNNYAAKLKASGNKAYGSKDYNKAIDLYGKAILCKPDPVYYSNRAACYNVLSDWDKVVEDTSAAISMDYAHPVLKPPGHNVIIYKSRNAARDSYEVRQ